MDWTLDEVEAVVGDYFDMLRKEMVGRSYSKTAHRQALAPQLNGRSNGSIEFKHANISAVLVGFGLPYIEGYKPRGNYQELLEQRVLEYVATHDELITQLATSPLTNPSEPETPTKPFSRIIEAPPDPLESAQRIWTPNAQVSKIDFALLDSRNRRLGQLGEEFVLELERRRLHDDDKRADLAKKIEWTSHIRGDGAGYDIASFNADGSRRFIEVKTTGLGKAFPFYVSANEVRCSEVLQGAFHLYRVFRFSRSPRVFILPGALASTCVLEPVHYQAKFQG